MQNVEPKIYLFIENFIPSELYLLNKNISIILRNYQKIISGSEIVALRNFCKTHKRRLYLANDIKRAIKYKLNGVYIPSFNKDKKDAHHQAMTKVILQAQINLPINPGSFTA